jgi:hypothetical protein
MALLLMVFMASGESLYCSKIDKSFQIDTANMIKNYKSHIILYQTRIDRSDKVFILVEIKAIHTGIVIRVENLDFLLLTKSKRRKTLIGTFFLIKLITCTLYSTNYSEEKRALVTLV